MATSGGRQYPAAITPLSGTVVANPAAGADFSIPISGNNELFIVTATLTTSATVATRVPSLQILDAGSHVIARGIAASTGQAASLTQDWTWAAGFSGNQVAGAENLLFLPSGLLLPSGSHVNSITTGIQAADQWSNIVVTLVVA